MSERLRDMAASAAAALPGYTDKSKDSISDTVARLAFNCTLAPDVLALLDHADRLAEVLSEHCVDAGCDGGGECAAVLAQHRERRHG